MQSILSHKHPTRELSRSVKSFACRVSIVSIVPGTSTGDQGITLFSLLFYLLTMKRAHKTGSGSAPGKGADDSPLGSPSTLKRYRNGGPVENSKNCSLTTQQLLEFAATLLDDDLACLSCTGKIGEHVHGPSPEVPRILPGSQDLPDESGSYPTARKLKLDKNDDSDSDEEEPQVNKVALDEDW